MMEWIVQSEDKGKIVLVSKDSDETKVGLLHKGSYLTIESGDKKFILRVDETRQNNPYSPSPMIIDMDLSPLLQDQKCKNLIYASRIMEIPERKDGISGFVKPNMKARRSNQEEIDLALGNKEGLAVFPATVFMRSAQHLCDDSGKFILAKIPEEVFFHQMIITGRTGQGKTVSMKYIAQYFLEEFEKEFGGGAVLAVNVKEEDLLTMDKKSEASDELVEKEWLDLGLVPHGVETFRVYYPANQPLRYSVAVNSQNCEKINLKSQNVDPEALIGLVQNLSDLGADQLPGIFRFWKRNVMRSGEKMKDFLRYFSDPSKNREYTALNSQEDEMSIKLFPGTYQNILNAVTHATSFFDVEGATELNSEDILQRGKFSVIDVTGRNGFGFGSVLLRDLLDKIYESNSKREKDERIPVLIIIDEVHEFYGNARSKEALQTLDAITRKGRSLKIGVIFASQNPEDMPSGIQSVVNTKIHFNSDIDNIRSLGVDISGFDPEALKPGYAVARIHGLSQLKFLKFPLALAGVKMDKKKNG